MSFDSLLYFKAAHGHHSNPTIMRIRNCYVNAIVQLFAQIAKKYPMMFNHTKCSLSCSRMAS